VNRAGTYVYQLKDYDRALADLNIALKLDPKDAYSYSLRADVWYQKRDYQRAIADSNAAIKLDPKEPTNYKRRADAESQLRWAWLP
jgi:tetratricopeptide (TPR) repeat protein